LASLQPYVIIEYVSGQTLRESMRISAWLCATIRSRRRWVDGRVAYSAESLAQRARGFLFRLPKAF